MPKKVLKTYEEIEEELFTIIDDTEFVAESASSLSNKLHQICNGAIYEDQDPLGEPLPPSKRKVFTLHKEKLNVLEDIIEEFNGKPILVGYKFKHDRKALADYFGKNIRFFDDAKTGKQKQKLQKDWNDGKIQLLAGNPSSVGHGLNLQKGGAHVVVLYSVDHDYETYDQFVRRLYRSGNKSKSVFFIHIVAKGFYDAEVVYKNIMRKKGTQDNFMADLVAYRKKRKNKCK